MVRDWTDPRDGTQWKVRITLAAGSMDLEDPFATVKVFRIRFGRPGEFLSVLTERGLAFRATDFTDEELQELLDRAREEKSR